MVSRPWKYCKNGHLMAETRKFYKGTGGMLPRCSVCKDTLMTTEIYRKHRLKSKYGMTLDQYQQDTGEIRGLLCNNCNMGIGLLREDTQLMFDAIEYIMNRSNRA